MLNIEARQGKVLLVLLTVIILIVGFYVFNNIFNDDSLAISVSVPNEELPNEEEVEIKEDTSISETVQPLEPEEIKIFVTGEVKEPGVIALQNGSRLSDAIELVGGLTSEADLLRVNLAIRVIDEGMYVIPKIGEELPVIAADTTNPQVQAENDTKININSADQATLESLPGIGPSRATAIIDYRDRNGPFANIEGLKEVSGIGDKIFDGLREQITVE